MSESLQVTIVYEEGEDGWIVASIPEVPGAHSQGRTRDEARANVTSADGRVPDECFYSAVALWAMFRLHDRCQHEFTLRVPLDVRDPPQILRHKVRPVILDGPRQDPGIRWPPSP